MTKKFHDIEYLRNLKDIFTRGETRSDRTGTGTIGVFGTSMRFDLSDMSIPVLTTKEINLNSVIHELLWFISGDTNTKYLNDNNVKIWNPWADEDGELGPVYGRQWRNINGIDQLLNAIELIKHDPTSRRIIVDSWNVSQLTDMALPPCPLLFQFWVKPYTKSYYDSLVMYNKDSFVPKGELSCCVTIRSSDTFLGLPFDLLQYSILTHIIAQITGNVATEIICNSGDSHIYLDHLPQVKLQLARDPKKYTSPTLSFTREITDINDIKFSDIKIEGYRSQPRIPAKVSV